MRSRRPGPYLGESRGGWSAAGSLSIGARVRRWRGDSLTASHYAGYSVLDLPGGGGCLCLPRTNGQTSNHPNTNRIRKSSAVDNPPAEPATRPAEDVGLRRSSGLPPVDAFDWKSTSALWS